MNPVRVPDDNRSIHAIGEYIMSQQTYQNAFLNALVNRIGRVIVTSRMWRNPWAVFKKGKLEYGETVEEIFVNITKPHSYDPERAEAEVFKREIPDVRAAFHSMNFQKFYKQTISNDQLRQAFLSFSGISDLIARIVDAMYTSMNLDEYLTMKYMMCRELLNGGFYQVKVQPVSTDPEDSVEKFREYTNNLTFLKSTYNRARVRTSTPVESQVIIIPNAIESVLGVKVLASAFNISEVDYISRRIPIDSFDFDADDQERLAEIFENDPTYEPISTTDMQTLSHVVGIKTDPSWAMVFDNYEQFTENYNGQGLYWQYFYHIWKTFSVSPFANAIAFTDEASTITGVDVSPESATVAQGTTLQLTATVVGTGMFDRSVLWSIEGQTSADTRIDPSSGALFVARSEPASSTITVTATAVDGTCATSTVTVTAGA